MRIAKNELILLFATLLVASNCWNFRFLQGWSDPNCAEWSQDGQTCLKCIPRSYNNTEQNKCIRVDDNCKTWSETTGECIKCYDSYGDAWKNGNAIDGKCPYYNGPQNQTDNQTGNETLPRLAPQIIDGYDLNCKCYSDIRECLECYSDYVLDQEGQCVPRYSPQCIRFGNGVCLECSAGYYLDQSFDCVQLPANCTAVDQNGNCTQCAETFILTEAGGCVAQVTGCVQYSSEGMCIRCQKGYTVNSTGECEATTPPIPELPDNCITADEEGNCTQCKEGYSVSSQGQCQVTSPELPQNCNATDEAGNCTQCEQGYTLVQGSCQMMPKNCMQLDENGICSQCEQGYYLTEQKECEILPANCTMVNAQGQCTQCEQGFVIMNGECTIEGGLNPDCAQQDQEGMCIKCRTFYELINGSCITTGQNPFCKKGACQCGTGKCLQCRQGYFLDNNGICIEIGQNCLEYSIFNGSCTICPENFELAKGECVPSSGRPYINLDCRTQTKQGQCLSCRKYYKLENGKCYPTGENPRCHLWTKDGDCQCCYYPDKYYLDNNHICQQRNRDCFQFNPQNGYCTQCLDGSTPQKGRCPKSPIPRQSDPQQK